MFLKLHYVSSFALIYFIWHHTQKSTFITNHKVILVPVICLVASQLVRALYLLQNIRIKAQKVQIPRLYLVHHEGAIQLRLWLPWPTKIRAGQYMYLWIPAASIFSTCPILITWWGFVNGEFFIDGLVRKRKKGHSDRISRLDTIQSLNELSSKLPSSNDNYYYALFDGLYGAPIDLSSFSRIVMFATDIGIASHISFILELLHGVQNGTAKTKHIYLFWEIAESMYMLVIKVGV